MKLVIRLAAILFVISVVAAAQTAEVDWDRGTDFSRFHTFTWAKAPYPIQDPDVSLGMARAVQQELVAKGVQYVPPEQRFDLFVTYNAKINPDQNDLTRSVITITVRIFDSRNDTIIWKSGGYVSLVNDKVQNRRNVRALLAEMFQKFPPH